MVPAKLGTEFHEGLLRVPPKRFKEEPPDSDQKEYNMCKEVSRWRRSIP